MFQNALGDSLGVCFLNTLGADVSLIPPKYSLSWTVLSCNFSSIDSVNGKLFCASEDYSGEEGPVNEFWGNNKIYRGDITLKDYSGIASDAMIFPGVTIPEGCTVGAKSFIHTKNDLQPWGVYLGNPAKLHKPRNKENVLKFAQDPNFLKQR